MPSLRMLIQVTLCSLTALMCAQGALAHTIIKDEVTGSATSTTRSYNAFVITHGCRIGPGDAPFLPVIGQSAVFPFGPPAASLTDPGAVWVNVVDKSTLSAADVTAIIGVPDLDLGVVGIQDRAIYEKETVEADPLGVIHALNWVDGRLKTGGSSLFIPFNGLTQFSVSAPMIADACVSKLRVRIAVSNWCEKKQNEASDPDKNRADWWFTAETGTTKFVDPALIQSTFWTTLSVNNPNVATDAAAAACPGGAPREVAVMPSGADIDAYLPLRPFTKGPPPL